MQANISNDILHRQSLKLIIKRKRKFVRSSDQFFVHFVTSHLIVFRRSIGDKRHLRLIDLKLSTRRTIFAKTKITIGYERSICQRNWKSDTRRVLKESQVLGKFLLLIRFKMYDTSIDINLRDKNILYINFI